MAGVKGRSGGRPKPTAEKRLAGNPGKRPLNDDEPQPEIGAISPPGWLSREARAEWRRVTKYAAPGVVAKVDRALLAIYCHLWAEFVESKGVGFPSTKIARLHALAGEFGMGAASRGRLHVTEQKRDDEDEDFFGGIRAIK